MSAPAHADPVHVFFDMDGVLVNYDPDTYRDPARPWERTGRHYFAHLDPDRRALALATALARQAWADVSVCSRTSRHTATPEGKEQLLDKRHWCEAHLVPYLRLTHTVISHTRKEDSATATLGRPLTATDILIDDFNTNLVSWEMAGGRAIKWLNGLNSAGSWPGTSIDPKTMTIDEMVTAVLREAHRHTATPLARRHHDKE